MYKNISSINLDIDNEILKDAIKIINILGLTLEDSANLFLNVVIDKCKIPF